MDAVAHLFEVEQNVEGKLPDEPLSGNTSDPDDYEYLNHIYTVNLRETFDMVFQWRKLLDDYQLENGGESLVMMTERYGPPDEVTKYYGNSTHEGAQIPFNFQLIGLQYQSKAQEYVDAIDSWMKWIPGNHFANWVVSYDF